jgi:hypothetical protein
MAKRKTTPAQPVLVKSNVNVHLRDKMVAAADEIVEDAESGKLLAVAIVSFHRGGDVHYETVGATAGFRHQLLSGAAMLMQDLAKD